MDSLTLKEKIGQLVQLDGRFFGAEEVPTGPCAELGIEPWVAENAGSVLNVLGAEKVYDVQKRHLEHSRIRLLFMADIVYGIHTDIGIVFCNTMCYQFMSGYIVRNNDTIKAPFFE